MPKHTALALGAAFLTVGIVFIVLDQLVVGLAFVGVSAVFDTLFVFAVRAEHQRCGQSVSRSS